MQWLFLTTPGKVGAAAIKKGISAVKLPPNTHRCAYRNLPRQITGNTDSLTFSFFIALPFYP